MHLDDSLLTKLIAGELHWMRRVFALLHLLMCPRCRARKSELEAHYAMKAMVAYKQVHRDRDMDRMLSEVARQKFLDRCDQRIEQHYKQRGRTEGAPATTLHERFSMNPALAIAVACSLMAVVSFGVWFQQRTPSITSNQFLVKAVRWEQPGSYHEGSVVFQRVRITAARRSSERSIYRDPTGRRRPRAIALAANEQQLKTKLAGAGVNWDDPLSASGYQRWRELQQTGEDEIHRTEGHTLTLRTKAASGLVAEESLTVTDTDYRPVIRTVEFRDKERVEIAELEYKVLPWDKVASDAFEPIGGLEQANSLSAPNNVIPFPHIAEELTEGQLDEVELGARMVLNRMRADAGEQIEIHRMPQGVEVSGYVESDSRKRELLAQLDMLPHVTPAIRSASDANRGSGSVTGIPPSIKTGEMPLEVSPFDMYLRSRGYSVAAISSLSQRLFDTALRISQESKALSELKAQFSANGQRTLLAAATLSELRYSHRERLETAIEDERKILAEIGCPEESHALSQSTGQPLASLAEKHLELSKELTATNHPAARKAETILPDLLASLRILRAEENQSHAQRTMVRDGRN